MMRRLLLLLSLVPVLMLLAFAGCKTADVLDWLPGADANTNGVPPVVEQPPPPAPTTTTIPPVVESEWSRKPKIVKIAPMSAGKVLMDTRGVEHQTQMNHGGMWEYMFLTLRGTGFDRAMLLQAGGGGRAIRGICEPGGMQMEIASDKQPDVHTWGIQWGGGWLTFSLDGKQIGKPMAFSGAVNQIVAGGYDGTGKRDFRGEWSNLRVTP